MTNLQNAVFLKLLKKNGIPQPVPELTFHPKRRWRFDWAFPEQKVAVAFQGGLWMTTRTGRSKGHAHPKRYIQDMEKYSQAAALGWRIVYFLPTQCANQATMDTIKAALEWKEGTEDEL